MKKILFSLLSFLCCAPLGVAGSITGQIQTPSTGRGVPNGTLTFTLSQVAVISGTATLAANGNCWTDTNGNVVGLPGDAAVAAPVLSSNLGSGSLGAGTYFVRYTWANATGESQPSAERSLALTSAGTLIVQAPASVPSAATSMKVYIGTTSGAGTLQGSVAVTNGFITGNYNQGSGLAAGAALPSNNTSVCQIRFNDELQPSYTGYSVAFTNVNGAGIAGFPQKWYLSGGSNGTINVGVGLPLYSGVVVYPQPIISNPAANGMQSINGPLNMNGFPILNTAMAPLISTTTNPAGSGVVRVASVDVAVAFRNAANSGDVNGLTKDASDVVQVGGAAGMKINGGSALTTSNQSGTGSLCMTTNCSMTTPNIGSATATAVTTTNANPATSGVLRCAGNQACAVARTPDNTNDVQLGYALNGPLAVFGSIGGFTSGVTAAVGELRVDTGVTVQSTGFKHFRLASGTSCTTPGTQGSGCTTGSISLPGPPFPDANYTVVCIMEGPATGSPVIQGIGSKTASSFTLGVTQVGGAASSYGAADCIAIHD